MEENHTTCKLEMTKLKIIVEKNAHKEKLGESKRLFRFES